MTSPVANADHAGRSYRPDIDGLRAVAVLAVVGYHVFPNLVKGGFVGVDIFFVISGFLISSILYGQLAAGRFSYIDFYTRRIRRIFPALVPVLALSLVFGWFCMLDSELRALGGQVAGGSAFVSNFVLWSESGYFDADANSKPLLHLWSLAIEEQFYLFFPWVLWFAWRRGFSLLKVTFGIALLSFAVNMATFQSAPVANFYSPLSRWWELMIGSILAVLALRPDQSRSPSVWAPATARAWLGAALIVTSLAVTRSSDRFPGWLALLPTLGTALLISAGGSTWFNRVVLGNRFMVWVGGISYPLYLWHWLVYSIAWILAGGDLSRSLRAGLIALSILLAWLTYRLLEKPLRFGPNGGRKALALLAAVAALGGAGLLVQQMDQLSQRPVQQAASRMEALLDYDRHWQGWSDCDIVTVERRGDGGCRVLDPNRPVTAAVVGDSHAGHLASGLRHHYAERNVNVAVLMRGGCYPVFPVTYEGVDYFDCERDLTSKALRFAMEAPSVRVIVLSGFAALQIQKFRWHELESLPSAEIERNVAALDMALGKTLAELTASGKRVVFMVDVPELRVHPRHCINRLVALAPPECHLDVPRADELERNRQYYAIVDKYRRLYPAVSFVDTSRQLCDEQTCYGQRDGVLLYQSPDHITVAASRMIIEGAQDALDAGLP